MQLLLMDGCGLKGSIAILDANLATGCGMSLLNVLAGWYGWFCSLNHGRMASETLPVLGSNQEGLLQICSSRGHVPQALHVARKRKSASFWRVLEDGWRHAASSSKS